MGLAPPQLPELLLSHPEFFARLADATPDFLIAGHDTQYMPCKSGRQAHGRPGRAM